MQLHPTRATFQVAVAGLTMVGLGAAARIPAMVAFGGAVILAIAVGRAIAQISVTRLRAAGFEMLWVSQRRVVRTARGGEVTLEAELRNRGEDETRAVHVRAVSSSLLSVTVDPHEVDIPARSSVRITLTVRANRVGRWGVHGMALEVRGTPAGGEGLYEVPLMFANPFGIEVFPRALHAFLLSPKGGRSRRRAEAGRPAALPGDGDELRELREHVPGDPFKRIAWKASARRGQLVVREMEREERDVVWFVLDASVELWAGAFGRAPLDSGVDEIATLSVKHLARGDQAGLVVTASRLRAWIPPAGGAAHATRLAAALTSAANMIDADRCELDEREIGARVAEHARPLDPRGLADITPRNLDMLAARAEGLRARAPFAPRVPFGRSQRERTLRHYLASFGVEVPPRVDGERERTSASLAQVLEKIAGEKKRPSIVHVWAPAPAEDGAIARALRKLKARRIAVRWSLPPVEESIGRDPPPAPAQAESGEPAPPLPRSVREAADEAVRMRARAAHARSLALLRKLGVARAKRVEPPSA